MEKYNQKSSLYIPIRLTMNTQYASNGITIYVGSQFFIMKYKMVVASYWAGL